jgi:cell division protein FtsW
MKPTKFLLIVFTLLTIGLIFISISSLSEASSTIGDKFFFIKKQLIWSLIGIFSFIVATYTSISKYKKYIPAIYFISVALLGITLIPSLGNTALGARRWLDLGIFGIQPSEIFKLAAILFFAKLFSTKENITIKYVIYYLSIPIFLIILEPNMSTAILVMAIIITLFYVSGGNLVSIVTTCLIAILCSSILIITSPYRKARLDTTSYHSNQMSLTLISGHLFGKGFANSDQKYRYLPKISTDSILAVIGEETGFIGISLVIILYGFLINYIFIVGSRQIPSSFEHLLTIGIGCWISFQSLVNMGAVVSLIPLTGVTLPLISYGGSSLVTNLFSLGLVYNLLYSTKYGDHQKHNHHRHPSHPRYRTNPPAKARS